MGAEQLCTVYRYRQADRTCQVASAKSTASEAVQAGMGAAASAHFQPSRYSRLVEVPSHAQMHCSTSPVKHCVADALCRLHILQARFVCLAVCRTSCSCKPSFKPTRLHTHTTHLTYWTQQPYVNQSLHTSAVHTYNTHLDLLTYLQLPRLLLAGIVHTDAQIYFVVVYGTLISP